MATDQESVDLVSGGTTVQFTYAVLLAALTGALAQVAIPIPFSPAPVSLQPFGVYFAGLLLGPVWGGFAILLYLVAGVMGVPVFADGAAGLGVLVGPTGGYLVGFLVAAVVIGYVTHRPAPSELGSITPGDLGDASIAVQVLALAIGLAIIYAIGVPWLGAVAGYGLEQAAMVGMVVFLPGDVLKIAVTVLLVKGGHLASEGIGAPA